MSAPLAPARPSRFSLAVRYVIEGEGLRFYRVQRVER